MKKNVLFIVLLALLTSCASREKIVYFQGISSSSETSSTAYEPVLKPDDLLMIVVSAPDAEAALPYNLPMVSVMNANNAPSDMGAQLQYQSYLIDSEGNIQFPGLGVKHLAGYTRTQAVQYLTKELTMYIKDPIVNLRILNYKVSVMGEVLQPGVFNVTTERITLPEALSRAGDLTIYGNRSNILVIREVNGKKTHNFVDITKADFINSPYYYLSQNDLVYVEPNKTKINSSSVGPNTGIIISAVSLLITVVALVIR